MARTGSLIPLIERAYGTPVSVDFTGMDKAIAEGRERKEKQADKVAKAQQSLYEIGAELDSKGWAEWSKPLSETINQLSRGELVEGTPAWHEQLQKLETSARAIREGLTLVDQAQKALRERPDKTRYNREFEMPDGTTAQYNAGYGGFIDDLSGLRQKEYESPFGYAQDLAALAAHLGVSEYSQRDIDKMMEADAKMLSTAMLEGIIPKGTSEPIGGGYVANRLTYEPDPAQVAASRSALAATYADHQAQKYYDAVGQGIIDPSEVSLDDYVTQNMGTLIPERVVDTKVARDATPRPTPPTATERQNARKHELSIERSRDVRKDVREAIDTKNPEKILEYVAHKGYRGKISTDGKFFELYTVDGQKSGAVPKNIRKIPLNEESIYDFIVENNDAITLSAIYEQEEAATKESNVEAGRKNLTKRQIEDINKTIDDLWVAPEGGGRTKDKDKQAMNRIIEKYGLTGVSNGTGRRYSVIIDGESYGKDQKAEIKKALEKKISESGTGGSDNLNAYPF